jgi:hypothetical protein
METEERIKALEDEFMRTKTETKQLMLDIRALLMEAGSPLRSKPQNGKASCQNDEAKG